MAWQRMPSAKEVTTERPAKPMSVSKWAINIAVEKLNNINDRPAGAFL